MPTSIRNAESNELALLDEEYKAKEDPLAAIRKKELDAKKELLMNPIKMKQLQQMVN